eukprot:COSAG02_NODE_6972_length_3256_cov_1.597403_3_plen_132_part_00
MIATNRASLLWALFLCEAAASDAAAPTKLTLPSVLTNDAVLPASGSSIWGWAVPGAKVEVGVAGAHSGSYSTTAGAPDGAWEISLPAVTPSLAQSNVSISSGTEKLALRHVLFGDLILCGGQVGAGLVSYM